jgi:glycosyltransferase involved in cell wall biosynthesis
MSSKKKSRKHRNKGLMKKKVLILTFYADTGGLATMAGFVIRILKAKGYAVTVAFRIPYAIDPYYAVPFWQVLFKRPKAREWEDDGIRRVGDGVYLPELELTYNLLDSKWKKLVEKHDHYLTIYGSCLGALPYVQAGVNFLAWVATPYFEDKKDRTGAWPFYRKMVDRCLISPISNVLEKRILRKGTVLALSDHTRRCFERLVPGRDFSVMPMPIDDALFNLDGRCADGKTIGLAGRFNDKRKNVELFLEAAALCAKKIPDLKIRLIGGVLDEGLAGLVRKLDIIQNMEVLPAIEREQLPMYLKGMDIFVVSSYQEGLCIAALEAMGCGCPVVSTRCGGPQEYIEDGKNGSLVGFDAKEMSDRILDILLDTERRAAYSKAASQMVKERFSPGAIEEIFWARFHKIFS